MNNQKYMESVIDHIKEEAASVEKRMREGQLEFLGDLIKDMEEHANVIAKKKDITDEEERFLEGWDRLFQRHEVGEYSAIVRDEGMDILRENIKFRQSHPEYQGMTLVRTINKIAETYQ